MSWFTDSYSLILGQSVIGKDHFTYEYHGLDIDFNPLFRCSSRAGVLCFSLEANFLDFFPVGHLYQVAAPSPAPTATQVQQAQNKRMRVNPHGTLTVTTDKLNNIQKQILDDWGEHDVKGLGRFIGC